MNIKITDRWLRDYLDTEATPIEIQKYLSLCGPSVERIYKVDDDFIYEIEITSNRVDSASVFGIAQEAKAILPMFKKRTNLKLNPLKKYKFSLLDKVEDKLDLKIKILDKTICSRFTAIILDNISIKPSFDQIKKRLTHVGIKSINNVVDISNYLMVALGQPVHVFDYDKIGKKTMIMRLSKKGETIVTLDGKKIILPGNDIVIEDGEGKLIDLCGIMGGLNSAIDNKTKRVVLFVQTYNKTFIRQTTMTTGQRTVAATYFEKGLDEERVEPTLVYGVELLKKYAHGQINSRLYDIYPNPYRPRRVDINNALIDRLIGVIINKEKIIEILENLDFSVQQKKEADQLIFQVSVPSYRQHDIHIPEDLIEEIARIYGYHRLPSRLSPPAIVVQDDKLNRMFKIQQKIKYFLKHLGLNEVINYSMIAKKTINQLNLSPKNFLKLSNSISEEIEYLRISLIPSLIRNLENNSGKKEILKFFEIAKVYLPQKNNQPDEIYHLGIAVNTDFFDLKGIIESLLNELNINYRFEIDKQSNELKVLINDQLAGILKKINQYFIGEIKLEILAKNFKLIPNYKPINPFAIIKLDLTLELSEINNFARIKKISFQTSKFLEKIELINLYKNRASFRFYFASDKKNLTEEEAKSELKKISKNLSF
ncbi:MAG: phenylalanine--tRNA ligase subunit beta [Microgenomates group bacterium]|nr:phenylalanine--tRNA ligase subunit beta [Microgenomates group bacterium]